MASSKFKTEIDPWAEAMRGVRRTVKLPRKIRVLVVTRDKSGKILSSKILKRAA